MVTTSDIISLGWKHTATMKNGGSKLFNNGNFLLENHSDNFIFKDSLEYKDKYKSIEIKTLKKNFDIISIYKGEPINRKELRKIMVQFGIKLSLRDARLEKLERLSSL